MNVSAFMLLAARLCNYSVNTVALDSPAHTSAYRPASGPPARGFFFPITLFLAAPS
jgi:hypothetical protein